MASGFAITSKWGVDASGVAQGAQVAEKTVEGSAQRVDRSTARMGRSFQKAGSTIRVNSRRAGGAVASFAADMASGADATSAFSSAAFALTRGIKGGLLIGALAGGAIVLGKRFLEAKSAAKDLDKQLQKIKRSGSDLQNLSAGDLLKNFKLGRDTADSNKPGSGIINAIKKALSGNTATTRAGLVDAGNAASTASFSGLRAQMQAGNRTNHLRVTGRGAAAGRAEFAAKEAQGRAELQQKLIDAKMNDSEQGDILGIYDKGGRDRRRAAGIHTMGAPGRKQVTGSGLDGMRKMREGSLRDSMTFNGGLDDRATGTPMLNDFMVQKATDAHRADAPPPFVPSTSWLEKNVQSGIENPKKVVGAISGGLGIDSKPNLGGGPLSTFSTLVSILKTIADNTGKDKAGATWQK